MATLDQLRALFPDAESDADLIRRASKDFGIDPAEISSEVGYKVPKGGLTSQQFSSSIDRYQAGLYGLGEEVTKAAGLTGTSKYLRGNRQENELQADIASNRARELGAVDEFKNIHGVGDFGSYAKSLAIQSVPYAAEALVGGLAARGAMTGTRAALAAAEATGDVAAIAKAKKALDIGSTAGGTAASYPSSVGDVLSNQREQSPTGETRGGVAAALGIPYAALNAVGVESALMRGNLFKNSINLLDKGTGLTGAAARTAATATGVGLKEGASETGQEMINQLGRMSVDKSEQFFSDAAQERFKESFIGGAVLGGVAGGTLGGWRRSGNDVSQAISSGDQTNPPITTQQFTPPPAPPALSAGVMSGLTGRGADPLAGRSKLIGGEPAPAPAAPAAAGGSTDIAQAQQQAQIESQQIQKAQAQQAAREQIYTNFGIADPTNPTKGNLFGKPLFGPSVPAVADAIGAATRTMSAYQLEVAQAINKANAETGGKLLSFQFNANDPTKSVQKAIEAVGKIANAFQISHVQTVEEAAQILNEQSNTLKGAKLEQLNAIHQALTGEDTSGYTAEQQSKVAKGAKNVQQPKLQTTTGLGEVPVQGTASQTVDGGGGNVRPAEVQPIGAGSLGAGSLGLQVGQSSAEGIRTSTGSNAAVDVRSNAETLEEINGLLQQVFGGTRPEGAFDETENTAKAGTSGGTTGQSGQAKEPSVVTAVSEGNGGPRQYEIPAQYYNTDIMHIRPERRQEIINEVIDGALTPEVDRENVVAQEDRVQIVRMSLLEDMTAPDIATELNLETDTVDQQRRRLGIRLGTYGLEVDQSTEAGRKFMASLMLSAENFRSPEFPDGIGAKEFAGLYSAKDLYYDKGKFQHMGKPVEEEQEEGEQLAVTTDVKLQEELKNKPESDVTTQSAGQIKTAGGSQGNIDSLKKSRKDKKTGQQVLDIGALDQITNLEAEADRIRDALDDMAPKDPRRDALANRLDAIGDVDSGELGALWEQYAKAQTMRDKAAKTQGVTVDKEKEEVAEAAAPTELTGEEIAASEREDERRKEAAEKAKADQGEEDAVQEQSTDEGDVRQPTGSGEEVGEANARPKKPAGARKAKPEVKPVEEVKKEVKTPEEQWSALADQFPGMPPYESLEKDEKIRWDDVASRGVANLAAANTVLTTTVKAGTAQAPSITGDAKTLAPEVEKLSEGQTTRLEQHYGAKRGTDDFFSKLGEDVVAYASKGAEAVSAVVRDIVRIVAQGVLAAAIVVNPTLAKMNFQFNLPRIVSQTTEVRAVVPDVAKAKMSEAAQVTYSAVAPIARAANKAFMITDKAGGMLHVFHADGSLLVQDVALVGKDVGDKLEGAKKITPAGQYDLHIVPDAEYTGGFVYHMGGAVREDGLTVAVHAVYTGEASENRPERLATPTPKDNRISWGCINVNNSTMVDTLLPAKAEINGSIIFVMPENSEDIAKFFPAMTQTIEATEGTATGRAETRSVVAKEEEVRLASKSTPFSGFMLFDDLETKIGGMDLVKDQLEEAGIGNAIDLVSDWELVNDPSAKAEHGSLRTVNGRYVGRLNIAKVTDAQYAAEVARHEIAHAIDMGPHGGIYSAQPEMGVSVVNGKINAEGPVAKELFNLYNTKPIWTKFLAYPFDSTKHPELNNRTKVQLELFAQAFSIYTTPEGRAILEAQAPVTAAYFKEVIQDVKSAKPLQIQKAETAANRAAVLYARRQSKGNRGPSKLLGFDERIDELLASRSASFSEGLDNYLPPAAAKPAKSVISTIVTAARNGLLGAAITEDVVNMAGKYMRSAKDYLAAQYNRQKTRLEFEMRIERILEDFDKLPKNLQGTGVGSVNRYILDSTMQRKWGYYPGEERIGTQLFEADPDLAARFNAFPDDAQKLIKDVFEHGYTALDMKKTAVSKAVEREFAERERAAIGDVDALADLQKERKAMVAKLSRLQNIDFTVPYAYLGRYGDYIVVAKSKEFKHWQERAQLNDFDVKQAKAWLSDNSSNPDHYVVQFAETQGEADQLAAELIATGKFDMDGTEAGPKEAAASYIGDDLHLAVSRARNLANRQKGEGSEELDKLLGDLYLMTAAENSARKSEIARKYVYGANENMMRNLATSGRADAHFLSTMEHNDAITESLENMRNEARRNYKEAMPLYNELYTRQANSMDYKQPALLSQALTQATSLWFLSTSPAFYLQQILQTGVLSLPYMAGRLGYFRSARAIKTAYGDVAGLVKGLGVSEHVDFSKAPADVRGMLQTLVGMGKIDIGIDSDARSRAGEQGTLGKVVRKLQGVNNRIETINRATAAIAAYRGYLQRFGANNTDAATKFAAEVVSNSHGSYDGFNTPRVLNSDVGRVVGQFKRFQIIQLSMLAKLIHTSFKGASAEEKMVARRALAFITGHMAVLGGALGVPFVMQIGNLLTNLFGDDDEPKDFEYKLRQAIGDKALADLLLNGVPAAMGVNLGGKLGMGNVASILPFTDVDLTSRSGYEKVMVGMMGPFFGGLAPKFIDGAGMITQGEYYKGLELMMPNGIGNAMKGVRFATEGITMRNGDVVMKPEDISIADAAFQAVGLPTTTITGRQYTQKTKVEFDKFYADKAAEIKGAYVDANRDGDSAGMADARTDWENLQASRRRNGYKIQPMSELFMAVSAASKRQRSVVNGVETTKANKQFVANII